MITIRLPRLGPCLILDTDGLQALLGNALCVPKTRFCNIGDEVRRGQAVM
jgi:hypothetical protein